MAIALLREASSVFAPLALAIFIIALVSPLQAALKARMPGLAATLLTVVATIAVCGAFTWLVAWGFGRVGVALVADAARLQAVYDQAVAWLEGQGLSVTGFFSEHFSVRWFIGAAQQVTGRVNTALGFWLITFVYVIIGLIELDDAAARARRLPEPAASVLVEGSRSMAAKFRRYMVVRTQMSLITGLLVALFTWAIGLPFAAEWGVIAFTLNYIPFLGPFIATMFPTVIATIQFDTWQAVILTFVMLNAIQFVVGSWLEPLVSGNALSISPTLVLFAVFFWTWMWGLFGTFIGVPITIAALSFCAANPASRWISDVLGGGRTSET